MKTSDGLKKTIRKIKNNSPHDYVKLIHILKKCNENINIVTSYDK